MANLPGEFPPDFPRDGGNFTVPACAITARFGDFVFPKFASEHMRASLRHAVAPSALCLLKQLQEFFDAQPRIRNDTPQSPKPHFLVVGNDHPRGRIFSSQDHVTASLSAEREAGPLQDSADLAAG